MIYRIAKRKINGELVGYLSYSRKRWLPPNSTHKYFLVLGWSRKMEALTEIEKEYYGKQTQYKFSSEVYEP